MDLDYFRKQILERRKLLFSQEKMARDGSPSIELDQTRVGRLSRMDAIQIHQMSEEAKRRRQKELIALNAALTRIEEDEFGICQLCGNDIAPKRLEIDLSAVFCISCAQQEEVRT